MKGQRAIKNRKQSSLYLLIRFNNMLLYAIIYSRPPQYSTKKNTTQQAIDVALPKFAALGAYQGGQDRGPIFTSLAAFYATATSIATDTEPVASEGVRTPKANAVIARAEALPTPEPKI